MGGQSEAADLVARVCSALDSGVCSALTALPRFSLACGLLDGEPSG
jgi:hypothetical protein